MKEISQNEFFLPIRIFNTPFVNEDFIFIIIRLVIHKLDELIQLKGFAEIIDGPAIKILIGLLDNLATSYIPKEYHIALRETVDGFISV